MIGDKRERVTIQAEAPVADGAGGYPAAWSDVVTVWAMVEPTSGREFFTAGRLESDIAYRVVMRHRADVTAKHRLLWRGIPLAIAAITNPDMRRMELELFCTAGAAT